MNASPGGNYVPSAGYDPSSRAAAGGATPWQLAGAQFSSRAQNALLMADAANGGAANNMHGTPDFRGVINSDGSVTRPAKMGSQYEQDQANAARSRAIQAAGARPNTTDPNFASAMRAYNARLGAAVRGISGLAGAGGRG